MNLSLKLLKDEYSVCRLDPAKKNEFLETFYPKLTRNPCDLFNISITPHEISVVLPSSEAPSSQKVEGEWRCLMLEGPIPFTVSGVLKSILEPLAQAEIGIFALSTFDTDYVLVKKDNLEVAVELLRKSKIKVF